MSSTEPVCGPGCQEPAHWPDPPLQELVSPVHLVNWGRAVAGEEIPPDSLQGFAGRCPERGSRVLAGRQPEAPAEADQ